jgi:hypothetical protein
MGKHQCPGPDCHPYPTFDDDPALWGLSSGEPLTEAELRETREDL